MFKKRGKLYRKANLVIHYIPKNPKFGSVKRWQGRIVGGKCERKKLEVKFQFKTKIGPVEVRLFDEGSLGADCDKVYINGFSILIVGGNAVIH